MSAFHIVVSTFYTFFSGEHRAVHAGDKRFVKGIAGLELLLGGDGVVHPLFIYKLAFPL